jgi:hypothetical protein
MKSKLLLGLATIAALALPAVAQNSYCYTDRDGDQQTCVTNYNNNGYYGNQYAPSYSYPGYYGNYYDRGHDRDYWRHREHEAHERQEHQRHEWREHHRDRDWDR